MKKKLITTQQELDSLPAGATVWGSSYRLPEVPGSGSPYVRLLSYNETRPEDSPYDDALWWDYGNDFSVGSEDIMLPAILVWDGVAQKHVGVCPEMGCDGLTVERWSGVACDTCSYTFCY